MRRPVRTVVPVVATAALVAAGVALGPAGAAHAVSASSSYLVVYSDGASSAAAAAQVGAAGGTVVTTYSAIGVVVARSDDAGFAGTISKAKGVIGAASTAGYATRLENDQTADAASSPTSPTTGGDSLSGLQWDMTQIKAAQAQAITAGSRSVTVGDIDTGLDYTHPDLAANVDFANSASCVGGVANTSPAAWADDNGHGTHTAGTIAAASNGIGIVGVAPNVKIAGIKSGNAAGFFFPEAVICGFMWAATHGVDVTNNSYFADPYLFNCRNDATQRAIWKAEQRAILFAESNGVTVVAAEGNDSDDLAHPTTDVTSPDFPPGTAEERTITN